MADISFPCVSCGETVVTDDVFAGMEIICASCGGDVLVPAGTPASVSKAGVIMPDAGDGSGGVGTSAPDPHEAIDPVVAPKPAPKDLTCPVCWTELEAGDLMHLAVHEELIGDPILGPEGRQRFHATRFNNLGHAIDAMGMACAELACPNCRRRLPPGFVEQPHYVISIVGQQSSGKSYYLAVMTRMLSEALFNRFGVVFQDADPKGNLELTELRKTLFSAASPGDAHLNKTQLNGAMYQRVPLYGRQVYLPKPFVFSVSDPRRDESCSVIFYDNAGEHFRPEQDVVKDPGALHVASASGIIFLLDPFHVPEWRRAMEAHSDDPQLRRGAAIDDQDVILSEMRKRVFERIGLTLKERSRQPLAVVISKLDAWDALLPRPLEDPLNGESLNLEIVERNSAMLRSLIGELCPRLAANAEAFSEKTLYFAVSAFGHTPVEVKEGEHSFIVPDPRELRPRHTEAPVLWLLSEFAPELVSPRL